MACLLFLLSGHLQVLSVWINLNQIRQCSFNHKNMNYYRITGTKNKKFFINLDAVLWVEFDDDEHKILFTKSINDVLHLSVEKEKYQCVKHNLEKTLISAIQEGEE